MEEYFKDDKVVETSVVREAEIMMNDVSRLVSKILSHDQAQAIKCKNTLISTFSTIPSVLSTDQKEDRENNATLGPKLRPLCAANRAPNAPQQSHFKSHKSCGK